MASTQSVANVPLPCAVEISPQQAHGLATLPRDVQLCILSGCGTPDLAAVSVTCSHLRAVAQTDELWRSAADRAVAWKPALADLLRAVIAHTHWLPQRPPAAGRSSRCGTPAPAMRKVDGDAVHQPVADGGEWLLTRTASQLRECTGPADHAVYLRQHRGREYIIAPSWRLMTATSQASARWGVSAGLLSIQLRHTQLGVPEACLSFCRDVLQLWLDQGQPLTTNSEAILHSHFALRNRNHLQHFLQTFRIAATLVADSIALQLRALLMTSSRLPTGRSPASGHAWRLVHAAAAAYNAWLRSVASAVGSMHLMRAGVDPLGDLNMVRGGAAAFRSQVLLAYCIRGELQRSAASAIWRMYKLPGGELGQSAAPAADVVLVQRLAMEYGSSEAATEDQQQRAVTAEALSDEVAAMARLLDAFDVTDERRSYWWNRDGTHAAGRLQRHFGFVLRAGQDLSIAREGRASSQ